MESLMDKQTFDLAPLIVSTVHGQIHSPILLVRCRLLGKLSIHFHLMQVESSSMAIPVAKNFIKRKGIRGYPLIRHPFILLGWKSHSLSPSIDAVCDMLSPQFDHYFNLYTTQGVWNHEVFFLMSLQFSCGDP